ncbi:MAG: DUF3095 domain-containing protein [Oscillochloris sp.]|nr:DUF3095 domain-containing protein [Oscillochloris sp.]
MSTDFYANLAPLNHFADVTDLRRYVTLPDEWLIVITDVRGSTAAIAAGLYKEVNMVGAASIVAVLNVAGAVEIPFIFGGDGATLAIPPELLAATQQTLAALQALAVSAFGLELRAGIVPVADLSAAGHQVQVARLMISQHYTQAAFSGGIAYAERLVKDPLLNESYLVPAATDASAADLTGLECRWQDIPSRYGETISLLVSANPTLPIDRQAQVIAATIAQIEAIFGPEGAADPLTAQQLQASTDPRRLMVETRLRSAPQPLARLSYLARILALNVAVAAYRIAQRLRGMIPWWDRYRDLVFRTTDSKKYDDTLRMVLAGSAEQRIALERYLGERHQQDELVYGLHISDRAVMTCLVFERMGRQVHFVDGADGGYALAAAALKALRIRHKP